MRRVVISGVGSVSAAGANVPEAFDFLCEGKSGVRDLRDLHPDFHNVGS